MASDRAHRPVTEIRFGRTERSDGIEGLLPRGLELEIDHINTRPEEAQEFKQWFSALEKEYR